MERCALSNGDWIRAAANAIAFSRTGHAAGRGGGLTDTHRSDQAWRQLAEVLQHFWATDDLRITTAPATCPWKYRLRNIETNRANFACGRLKPLA